jgi:hypothetical protein
MSVQASSLLTQLTVNQYDFSPFLCLRYSEPPAFIDSPLLDGYV